MSTSKEKLLEIIESLPERDLGEVLDFVGYLIMKRRTENYQDLTKASESSTTFWNNSKDDEVWNNA